MTHNYQQTINKESRGKFMALLASVGFAAAAVAGFVAPVHAATIDEATIAFEAGTPTVEIVDKDGIEALHLVTPTDEDKAQVGVVDPDATLGELETLSYQTYREAGTGEQLASLNIVTEPWAGTFVYEPVYDASGMVTDGEWQMWDAFSEDARWWNSNDPDTFLTWDEIISGMEDYDVAGILVNQGSGNAGLDSYVDWVEVNGETYDFSLEAQVGDGDDGEQDEEAISKEDCKGYGWMALGFRNQGLCVSYTNTGRDTRTALPEF